jgi:hypothetical protein
MSEDLFELNAFFEAQYDTAKHENKVAELMEHAYARLKGDNPSSARNWDEAVQQLNKGDHYLLLLLDQTLISCAPSQKLLDGVSRNCLELGFPFSSLERSST